VPTDADDDLNKNDADKTLEVVDDIKDDELAGPTKD